MTIKNYSARRFKSSPLISAAASVAVCISGGGAHATSGNINASNAGNNVFSAAANGIKVFGGLASFNLGFGIDALFQGVGGSLVVEGSGGVMTHVGPGVQVSLITNFTGSVYLHFNQSNNYIPMRFNNGGIHYGWVHCVSVNAAAKQMNIDTWSYNPTALGGIKTLDESITPKKLTLSGGRVKLNWTNANEDGVARYEVQAKGVGGAWAAVDSGTPGAGSYAATVDRGGEYRLVVENTDGATRTLAF